MLFDLKHIHEGYIDLVLVGYACSYCSAKHFHQERVVSSKYLRSYECFNFVKINFPPTTIAPSVNKGAFDRIFSLQQTSGKTFKCTTICLKRRLPKQIGKTTLPEFLHSTHSHGPRAAIRYYRPIPATRETSPSFMHINFHDPYYI